MRATGTSSAWSSTPRYGKNSATRVGPGIGVRLSRGRLRVTLLATSGKREDDEQQDRGSEGPARHRRYLRRAAAIASRTRSGAVPPKLFRLATERSTSSTE